MDTERPLSYTFVLDHGTFQVTVPRRVSADDVEDIERLLSIVVRHAKRRSDPPADETQPQEKEIPK